MNGTYYKFDKNLLTKECQFVITKRRSKTIYDYNGGNEEECTGQCVRTQKEIERDV